MPTLENNLANYNTGSFAEELSSKFSNEEMQKDSAELLTKLAARIVNYKHRDGQKEMVASVSESLNSDKILVVEAGTGTGKTFSYLIGALPFILKAQKRLIVSTHTVSLQSQLIKKDLPLINAIVDNKLKIEIAKGGEHYFCPKRAHEMYKAASSGRTVETNDGNTRRLKNTERIEIANLLEDFKNKDFDGDLDALIKEESKAIIALVQRRRDRCPRKHLCNFGEECPYYTQRKKLSFADIIITNHALFSLSCIHNMTILGNTEKQLLVVDEAHHFAKVFRDQSEICVELGIKETLGKNILAFAEFVKKILLDIRPPTLSQNVLETAHHNLVKIVELTTELAEKFIELDQFLLQNFAQLRGKKKNNYDDEKIWKLGFDLTPKALHTFFLDMDKINNALMKALTQLQAKVIAPLMDDVDFQKNKESLSKLDTQYSSIIDELSTINANCKNYIEHNEISLLQNRVRAGIVRWITKKTDNKGNKHFAIHSNRSDIRAAIKSSIFDVFSSSIFTSATMKALGSFNEFFNTMGIKHSSKAMSLTVKSPFDYSRVKFSAPIHKGDPNSKDYINLIVQQVQQASLRHQAILVIFNSYMQMESVFAQCPPYLQEVITVQKKQGRDGIITHHCQQIDLARPSILFGVDSLAEGIDLKGQYLTCVMIAKFPFPNLNQPMLDYDAKQIEFYGRSSFNELSLPLCSRKLIQCVGRLIRTETDYGEIILLDSRAHTKPSYGKKLVKTLPLFD